MGHCSIYRASNHEYDKENIDLWDHCINNKPISALMPSISLFNVNTLAYIYYFRLGRRRKCWQCRV